MGAAKILIGGKKLRNLLKKLTLVDASGKVLSQRSRCGSYIVVKEMERITVRTTLERNLLLEKNRRPAGDLKTVTPELRFDKLGKIIHSLVLATMEFCLLLYISTPHPTKWCADIHIISTPHAKPDCNYLPSKSYLT
jgi:hypothetical protein